MVGRGTFGDPGGAIAKGIRGLDLLKKIREHHRFGWGDTINRGLANREKNIEVHHAP